MIIGENRVVERGGVLTARGTADPSGDPDERAHPVVNSTGGACEIALSTRDVRRRSPGGDRGPRPASASNRHTL
jgi:hypothetical protein